jgi:hypothetical protein
MSRLRRIKKDAQSGKRTNTRSNSRHQRPSKNTREKRGRR